MEGLKQVYNAHGVKALLKNPNIPDFHLMVGTAEDLSPQHVLTVVNKVPPEIAKNLKKFENYTDEEIENLIANNQIEVNDLNGDISTIGNPLGGV